MREETHDCWTVVYNDHRTKNLLTTVESVEEVSQPVKAANVC